MQGILSAIAAKLIESLVVWISKILIDLVDDMAQKEKIGEQVDEAIKNNDPAAL